MDLLIYKLPFLCLVCKMALEVGWYDMHFQVHAILTLQEAAEAYLVWLLEDANLWTIHVKCITIMPKDIWLAWHICGEHLHCWKSFSQKSVLVFLLVVGCVGFCQYQGREFSVGFALYIYCWVLWDLFLLLVHKNVFPPSQVELESSFYFSYHKFLVSLSCNEPFYCPAELSCGNNFFICKKYLTVQPGQAGTDLFHFMSFVVFETWSMEFLF